VKTNFSHYVFGLPIRLVMKGKPLVWRDGLYRMKGWTPYGVLVTDDKKNVVFIGHAAKVGTNLNYIEIPS